LRRELSYGQRVSPLTGGSVPMRLKVHFKSQTLIMNILPTISAGQRDSEALVNAARPGATLPPGA
jgi:hypothetical protein